MSREPHPLLRWEVTPTGYATVAAVLAAIIAGVCIGEFAPDTSLGRWLATDTGLFSYLVHLRGGGFRRADGMACAWIPSATKRPADSSHPSGRGGHRSTPEQAARDRLG